MVLEPGEKILLVTRRRFEGDDSSQFVGEVTSATDNTARVEGHAWTFDPSTGVPVKQSDRRLRVVSLIDAANAIQILPPAVELDALTCEEVEGRLVLSDGRKFRLDVEDLR